MRGRREGLLGMVGLEVDAAGDDGAHVGEGIYETSGADLDEGVAEGGAFLRASDDGQLQGIGCAQKAYKIALNFGQHLKENPNVKTIPALFNFYHKMLRYHLSPEKSKETQASIFGKLPPSILERNVRNAMSYTVPQLTNIISVLREYDVKSKGVDSTSGDAELLKELIYKLIH